MKPRENRQTIAVTGRMKGQSGWQDVHIRNVSAHGMKISVAEPPRRGAYIEVRRATLVIVARAVWVKGNECGLRTQDVIDIPQLLDPNAARAQAVIKAAEEERRTAPRIDETAGRSRRFAIRFQGAAMLGAMVLGAAWTAWVVRDAIARPFTAVQTALGG